MRYLLIIFLWFVIGIAQADEPPKVLQVKVEQQTKSSTKPKQKVEIKKESSDNSLAVTSPEAKSDNGDEKGTEFWPPLRGYRLKVTDTLLAAFTSLLFIATVFLYRATRRLVISAEDTAKMELRAYVSVDRGYISVMGDGVLRVAIDIRNTGQTMAKEAEVWFEVTQDLTREFDLTERKGKSVLMPNAVWRFHKDMPFYSADVVKLGFEGLGTVFAWGRIQYKDVFDIPRWTIFRFINGRPDYDGSGSVTGWDVQACDDGNDAT